MQLRPFARSAARAAPRAHGEAAGLATGGMLALAAAMGIGRFVYTPILPGMAHALALSKLDAGTIASANFLGYFVGSFAAALPHFALKRRDVFLAALALSAITTAGMALAQGMAMFCLLRFLGGIASAFVLILGSALVLERLAVVERAGLAAVHFAGVGLGIAASALLIDVLQRSGTGWRSLWLASGAVAALTIPIVAQLMPARSTAIAFVSSFSSARRSKPIRGLATLSLCHGLFGFGYVITATFIVMAVRGLPEARWLETAVWIMVGLSAIPSTALWTWAGRRWGALRAYGIACLVEAVGVAAGGISPTAAGALLAAVLLGGTFMGITALGFAAARALGPEAQHRSFALMTAGFGLGQIIGPIVAGWLMDRTHSFGEPSLLAAAMLIIAALIAAFAGRRTVST